METQRIKDFADVFSGYAFSSNDLVEEGIPVLKIGNIQNGVVLKDCSDYYNQEISEKLKKYILHPNDFLIAMTGAGSVGRAGKMQHGDDNEIFLVNQRVAIIRPKANSNGTFLYAFFRLPHIEQYLYSLGIGAGQPNISAKDILQTKVLFPNKTTQDKIAYILSKYDELIELNNKRIKKLEQAAEELYKEWFVRFRFPNYQNCEYKNARPSGWVVNDTLEYSIPVDWRFDSLSNIASFKRGRNLTTSEAVKGDIPVVSAGKEPSCYHNEANVKGYSITISSSGANAGFMSYHLDGIWAADCSYYQNDENIWFVYSTLHFIQKVIDNMQIGAAQPHVYPKDINELSVIIPDEKTMRLFNEKVNVIFEEIKTINNKNENLIKQRDYLLPRLMSGKLEV